MKCYHPSSSISHAHLHHHDKKFSAKTRRICFVHLGVINLRGQGSTLGYQSKMVLAYSKGSQRKPTRSADKILTAKHKLIYLVTASLINTFCVLILFSFANVPSLTKLNLCINILKQVVICVITILCMYYTVQIFSFGSANDVHCKTATYLSNSVVLNLYSIYLLISYYTIQSGFLHSYCTYSSYDCTLYIVLLLAVSTKKCDSIVTGSNLGIQPTFCTTRSTKYPCWNVVTHHGR